MATATCRRRDVTRSRVCLVRLSQLAADIPEILEIDINPLLADDIRRGGAGCENLDRSGAPVDARPTTSRAFRDPALSARMGAHD
jgi:hypothetical protein